MRETSARMVQIGRYLTEFSHIFFSLVKSQFVIKPNVGDTTRWSSLEVDYKLLLSLSLRAHYAKYLEVSAVLTHDLGNFEFTYKKFFTMLCVIFLQLYLSTT